MSLIENEILTFLQKNIRNPRIADYVIRDIPDALLEFEKNDENLKKAGLELTGIDLEAIYNFQYIIPEEGEIKKITYPLEPYYVFGKLVTKKALRRPTYINNTNIDEQWLLIHDPVVIKNGKARFHMYSSKKNLAWIFKWFDFIYTVLEHGFQRIYYLHSSDTGGLSLYKVKYNDYLEEIKEIPTETLRIAYGAITKNGFSINIRKPPKVEFNLKPIFKSNDDVLKFLKTQYKKIHPTKELPKLGDLFERS